MSSKMTPATADTARKTAQKVCQQKNTGQNVTLDGRYRQIGISAVAAAVRYQGAAKNPAYAPVPIKWRDLSEEAAG